MSDGIEDFTSREKELTPAMSEIHDDILRKINEYYGEGGFEEFLTNSDESYDLIYAAIDDLLYASIYDDDDQVQEVSSFLGVPDFDDSLSEDEIEEYFDNLTKNVIEFFNSDKMKNQMFG